MMLSMEWIQNMLMMLDPSRTEGQPREGEKEALQRPRFQDWSEMLIDF